MSNPLSLLATIATVPADSLEALGSYVVELWSACTSTLGRKITKDTFPMSPSDRMALTAIHADNVCSVVTSRNAMMFRAGSSVTHTTVVEYSAPIPAAATDTLESLGCTVRAQFLTMPNHQGIPSKALYAALCQLDATGVVPVLQAVQVDMTDAGYGALRNVVQYVQEYRDILSGSLGISHDTDECAHALHNAKTKEMLRGQCPVGFTLGWDATCAGDVFTLIRLSVAFAGRSMFTYPGAFNPGSTIENVAYMVRELRITAGTFSQGTVRGDRTICHPSLQRAADRCTGATYRAAKL